MSNDLVVRECSQIQVCSGIQRNRTNPNSIYVAGKLRFQGYKPYTLHCYIDTGASICLASKHVIPLDLWENTPKNMKITIADASTVKVNRVCRNIPITFGRETLIFPTIYQQESGMDIIVGNNVIQQYLPFTQQENHITFTVNGRLLFLLKIRTAMKFGYEGFLKTMKKGSKQRPRKGLNIARKSCAPPREIVYLTTEKKYDTVLKLLDDVCSEHPLDPKRTKGWMTASIHLAKEHQGKWVKVPPMGYKPEDRDEFGRQISELLKMGLIVHSKSPHSSPAFLVKKQAGKKRMVVDYKAVNNLTIPDRHNIPSIHELLVLLRGMKIFSSFDCKSGFWQVLIDEESQKLTAFTCPQGHFQWKVLPFGLKQAPAIYQRHMQTILNPLDKFSMVYIDDIVVFSKTEEEHFMHVTQVLDAIKRHGIILAKKKCQLFKRKINFLGLVIDEGHYYPQPHILEKIQLFPDRLQDKKQIQKFLGILTYCSPYIESLAAYRKSLQEKLKDNVLWTWTDQDTAHVRNIKGILRRGFPRLTLPDPDDYLIIETDASDNVWAGVLKARQEIVIDNKKSFIEKICRYISGTFKGAEQNYHSNEKEILAVINTIKKLYAFLVSKEFLIRTDNKNFISFVKNNITGDNSQGRRVRWQAYLSHYDFKAEHLAGVKNVLADALTREMFDGSNDVNNIFK